MSHTISRTRFVLTLIKHPYMNVTRSLIAAAWFAPLALNAQARPPIRPLGPVQATSKDSLRAISNIRALPGGRLLVNDVLSRRVLMMDSTFAVVAVVADSTPSTANAYGPRSGSLIAFRGDSTLFVDAASLSMLVIDPSGKIGRVMSVPRSQDAMMLAAGGLGAGAFYSEGHLVYRGMPGVQMRMGPNGPSAPSIADTMPIVRINLATRVLDTLGFTKVNMPKTNMATVDGKMSITIEVNPLPTIDEWTVTSDGKVAIVRGKDYHVDWVAPDGTRSSSPKIPFDWKRLTDDDKVAFIDSVKAQRERAAAANPNQGNQMAQAFGAAIGGSAGAAAAPMVMRFEARGGVGGGAGGPSGMPQIMAPTVNMVSPSELPDYQPPFLATWVKPDADGNVWVRTINTKPTAGGPVYDVINSKGEIVDRVQIPADRNIIGFGPGGVVILARTEGTLTWLERARVN